LWIHAISPIRIAVYFYPAVLGPYPTQEDAMSRMYLDCRESPGSNCTIAISADSEKELLEAAAQHAVSVHGHQDGPELRKELRKMLKETEEAIHA